MIPALCTIQQVPLMDLMSHPMLQEKLTFFCSYCLIRLAFLKCVCVCMLERCFVSATTFPLTGRQNWILVLLLSLLGLGEKNNNNTKTNTECLSALGKMRNGYYSRMLRGAGGTGERVPPGGKDNRFTELLLSWSATGQQSLTWCVMV